MNLTPQQHTILSMYLSGKSGPEIAKALGVNHTTVYHHLRNPMVKRAMLERMREFDIQLIEFKMKAIEASMPALEKLINLSQHAKEEKLQRDASLDVIRIAGLEPAKRVVMQGDVMNGIDQSTAEYFDTVVEELKALTE